MIFLVVRHGETTWNREARIQGHGDSPLTELGRAQARALAGRLTRERIGALYTSDLGRALETARPISAAVGVAAHERAGLRERRYGVFEGRTWPEIRRDAADEWARMARDAAYAVPGAESAAAFRERVLATLSGIVQDGPGERVAVVTHGGVVDVLHREATGLSLLAPRTVPLVNAGVNEFTYERGAWKLVRWGDADHLDVVTDADWLPAE